MAYFCIRAMGLHRRMRSADGNAYDGFRWRKRFRKEWFRLAVDPRVWCMRCCPSGALRGRSLLCRGPPLVAWIAFRVAVRVVKGLVRSIVGRGASVPAGDRAGKLILHDAYSAIAGRRRPCRPSCDGRPGGNAYPWVSIVFPVVRSLTWPGRPSSSPSSTSRADRPEAAALVASLRDSGEALRSSTAI